MKARYLIRFDDICPTMNWSVWDYVEQALVEHDIKPLLAVVPDNQDDELKANRPDPRFWQRVRSWQAKGWTIGLHGYQHRYVTRQPGMIGINAFSEFAGLPEVEQERKIRCGLEIFHNEGVRADAWVAPAHSFDLTTVSILARYGVPVISDGLSLFPMHHHGLLWIPQQLWRFREMPLGVWTVAYHINPWTPADTARFQADLLRYRSAIASVPEIAHAYVGRGRAWSDVIIAALLLSALRAKISAKQRLQKP